MAVPTKPQGDLAFPERIDYSDTETDFSVGLILSCFVVRGVYSSDVVAGYSASLVAALYVAVPTQPQGDLAFPERIDYSNTKSDFSDPRWAFFCNSYFRLLLLICEIVPTCSLR